MGIKAAVKHTEKEATIIKQTKTSKGADNYGE